MKSAATFFDKYCGKYMDKQLDHSNTEEMEIC